MRLVKLITVFPYVFFTIILVALFSPWVKVRFGILKSASLGHFAGNTELCLLEMADLYNDGLQSKTINIFCFQGVVSNRYLADMWSRELCVLKRWIVAPLVSYLYLNEKYTKIKFLSNFLIKPSQEDRDIKNLYQKYKPTLSFTKSEVDFGLSELEKMGVPRHSRFVCLTVRDSAYLESYFTGMDCSYHNFRDSDVDSYLKAAEYLASKGVYVIRMGAKVKKPLISNNPKIIDYATNGMRTEFMDVFLGANCFFCISQGTGFDSIPTIFRRPVVFVNVVPVLYCSTWNRKYLTIFKHHVDLQNKRILNFTEIFNNGLGQCLTENCFKSKDISLQDNTPQEIFDVVKEMYERLSNDTWRDKGVTYEQDLFWSLFPKTVRSEINNQPLHGSIESLIGQHYLEQMRDYLR